MTPFQNVLQRLNDDPALGLLVGERITPLLKASGDSEPSITYQRISEIQPYDLSLAYGVCHAVYQFDCWATQYETVQDIADHTARLLHTHQDENAGIQLISLSNRRDDFDQAAEEFRVILEINIYFF